MSSAKTFAPPGSNRLLANLPATELKSLKPLLKSVALGFKQRLYEPNKPISHIYFPLTCVVSLLVQMEDGGAIDVGTVGNEGLVGLPVFFGATATPGHAMVQIAGNALSISSVEFIDAVLRGDGEFSRRLHRLTQAVFVETAQGAACNRLHPQEKRFCRWMLMTHDRIGTDTFPMTHEFLAQMLGVRRATVSEVAAAMQGAGLIRYRRGILTILDRAGLEDASCGCYRVMREEFDRISD